MQCGVCACVWGVHVWGLCMCGVCACVGAVHVWGVHVWGVCMCAVCRGQHVCAACLGRGAMPVEPQDWASCVRPGRLSSFCFPRTAPPPLPSPLPASPSPSPPLLRLRPLRQQPQVRLCPKARGEGLGTQRGGLPFRGGVPSASKDGAWAGEGGLLARAWSPHVGPKGAPSKEGLQAQPGPGPRSGR